MAARQAFLAQSNRRCVTRRRWIWRLVSLFQSTVWQLLSGPARRRLSRTALGTGVAHAAKGCAPAQPLCVVGWLSSASGVGEGARLCGQALTLLGYTVRAMDVSPVFHGAAPRPGALPPLESGPGTLILHFNPEQLPVTLSLIGRARLSGKRVIAYWAWELPRIPPSWEKALGHVDEVWAPSKFVADAFAAVTAKPVRVVPHPVAVAPTGESRRADFAIPENAFVVLSFCSLVSVERKNPHAAIAAFVQAFGDDPGALLILKLSDSGLAPQAAEKLKSLAAGYTNIRVLDTELEAEARLNLIASADVFLSLHRAEGFGLIMAEAMAAGTAVVATGWSGNLDFMDAASACLVRSRPVPAIDAKGLFTQLGENWAEADVDHAAAYLTRLRADPAMRRVLTQKAQALVSQRLGLDAYNAAISEALSSAP